MAILPHKSFNEEMEIDFKRLWHWLDQTSRELLMQIKEMAENIGYEVLHGIVDCLWVIG